ncbi:uncharacterized protein LOC129728273 [Wyeomyia smithii]|uniref:uncharacterized protein LOC129728273 n=1 Tax=Wyeomyia smithii TaxID=174621 RepID=UPI002467F739|nr:uncharacterized protein LOC129728273 [Wyeomyia smithii]
MDDTTLPSTFVSPSPFQLQVEKPEKSYVIYACSVSLFSALRSLFSALLAEAADDSLEQVWVTINNSECKIVIGVSYIPPNLRNETEIIDRHISSVEKAVNSTGINDDLFLFGDFNRAGLSWSVQPQSNYLIVDALHSSVNAGSTHLLDGMAFNNMFQINPVRNQNGRFLDLIFANLHALPSCSVTTAPDPLCNIDVHHPPLMVTFNRPVKAQFVDEFDPPSFDFRRGNYEAISLALRGIDWSFINQCRNLDEAVSRFTALIQELIHSYIPKVRPRYKPTWGNRHLARLNRARKSTLRAYQRNRNPVNRIRLTSASRSYKALNRKLYSSFVRRTEHNLRSNPKSFWRFLNSKRKEDGLPSSMFLSNSVASTNDSKCVLFAKYFAGVFNSECASSDEIAEAMFPVPSDTFCADIFTISNEEVAEAICNLKQSFSPGPDGIPAVILKKCAAVLKSPLAAIFNLSLQCHLFPRSWKESLMFPVFKKGDK